MGWLLLLMAPASWAQAPEDGAFSLDEAGLTALVDELLPELAAVSGRALKRAPDVVISDRQTVARIRAEDVTRAATLAGVSKAQTRSLAAAAAAAITTDHFALYLPGRRQIAFLGDNVVQAFAGDDSELPTREGDLGGLPDAELVPILRCMLAHELVHAQQDEAGLLVTSSAAEAEARRPILEGQAELIAGEVCRRSRDPLIVGLLRQMTGWTSAPNGDRSALVLSYGAAPMWLEEQVGSDPVACWAVVAGPPPTEDELARAATRRCEGAVAELSGAVAAPTRPGGSRLAEGVGLAGRGGYALLAPAAALCTVEGLDAEGPFELGRLVYRSEEEASSAFARYLAGWRAFARFAATFVGTGFAIPAGSPNYQPPTAGQHQVFAADYVVVESLEAVPLSFRVFVAANGADAVVTPQRLWVRREGSTIYLALVEGKRLGRRLKDLEAGILAVRAPQPP